MNDIQQKISEINGQMIAKEMDEKGYILVSQFLPVKYCKELIDKYGNVDLYRKIITMEKYRFGLGEYKYFKYPLPNLIHIIRKGVYPILAPIANNWMRLLNLKRQFPNGFEKLQQVCHDNNQVECSVVGNKWGYNVTWWLWGEGQNCLVYDAEISSLYFDNPGNIRNGME
jgi:hypothetical protein